MKIAQVNPSTVIKAVQLMPDNIHEVHSEILPSIEKHNIVSWSVVYPVPEYVHAMGVSPYRTGRISNMSECGLWLTLECGTNYRVRLYDWLVISCAQDGSYHIDTYDPWEFLSIFSITDAAQENIAFNMSLINDANLQRIFSNPNDYRLFRHIIDVYVKQLSTEGAKNAIPLRTTETMTLCQMSDKTFRKSRNSLIDMGIIYESVNGYKISFEVLNSIISNLDK